MDLTIDHYGYIKRALCMFDLYCAFYLSVIGNVHKMNDYLYLVFDSLRFRFMIYFVLRCFLHVLMGIYFTLIIEAPFFKGFFYY